MIGEAEILVVRARLAELPCDRAALSAAERARAARLPPVVAHAFVAGRALLRRILGRALGVDPASLVIVETDASKPRLADHEVDFNVSHGGEWLLVATAHGCHVGIDVEPLLPVRDAGAIADALGWVPLPSVSFAQQWARLEALCKATGRGLTIPIDDDIGHGLSTRDLVLAPDHAAAIAWTGSHARITEIDV